jgi:D-alanyl-D-alanine dipeptidase
MRIHRRACAALVCLLAGSNTASSVPEGEPIDPGFVDLAAIAPAIRRDIRYAGSDNFVGAPVTGYEVPRCLLSAAAAGALARLQQEIQPFGLGLIVYDCYRPQRAVNHFMRWSRDPADQKTRARYYPNEDKATLFEKGYLDERSGHSRGSTVDLGLVDGAGREIDMGTGWDHLDPLSATEAPGVGEAARRNRLLLRALMEKHGFRNYPAEWWHFTLVGEPWPARYFDLPIR